MKFINVSAVKKFAKEKNRRVGKDFLELLDEHIERKLEAVCTIHNGSKKTLDRKIGEYAGIKSKIQ